MTQPVPRIPALAALALVVFLFGVNIYRAWTQSITADEAFAHNLFLTGPPSRLFNSYDAAHHVFHTILSKLSISLFGLSEFTLRIPSLLGGLLYLVTVLRLSRYVFGPGWLMLLTVALLTLNPFVLDYLSAARGYGLALGLFLYALFCSVRHPEALYKIGLALALSAGSNLTLLFPAAALALALVFIVQVDGARRGAPGRFDAVIDRFIVPATVIAFLINILPLTKARMEHFYVGAPSLRETMRSLIGSSLIHHEIAWIGPHHSRLIDWTFGILENFAIPALLVLAGLACVMIMARWFQRGDFRDLPPLDWFLLLAGGTTLLSLALSVAAHKMFGVLYPIARTGLYLIPLVILLAAALWKHVKDRRLFARAIALPAGALALACLFQFVIQFQTSHYAYWEYDAGTKRIVNLIRERHAAKPRRRIRTGVSWELEPSISFYRQMYRLDWMEPVTREGPEGRYDYYVLLPRQAGLMKELGLALIYTDPVSRTVLAEPASGP